MNNGKQFELETLNVLRTYGKIDVSYQENNSVHAMEIIKKYNKNNKLFLNACSLYRTEFGHQKKTEFVYCSPENNIDWRIECKSRQTIGLIGEIKDVLDYVKLIKESLFCLVLTDNLCRPYILNQLAQLLIEKGIEDKVWIGTLNQFTTMFKQKLSA